MRPFRLGFALLASALVAGGAQAQRPRPAQTAPAASLLRRMIDAERTTAYIAREETFRADAPGASHVVKSDPRRGVRREPASGDGRGVVAPFDRDKRGARLPEPMRKRVEDLFKRLARGALSAQIVGQDTVAGRVCDIVEVRASRLPQAPTRRFFVDRETGLRLRTEEKDADGKLLSGSYYTLLDLTPTFAPDDFAPSPRRALSQQELRPRPDYAPRRRFKSVDDARKAGVTLSVPGYMPVGYSLRAVEATASGDYVALRYANGLGALSLTTLRGGVPARVRPLLRPDGSAFVPFPQGKNGLFARGKNGVAYLIISDLPETELRKIAANLK